MTDHPTVSVLIPSYNHAPFVRRAVESVLEQTYSDLEIVVVDDASSDATAAIVAEIGSPRVRLTRNAENRERHPRNTALALARGAYVAFQNSDDVWMPEKLERQIAMLEDDPGAVACFSDVGFIDDFGQPSDGAWAAGIFDLADRPPRDWLRRFFDKGNCLPLPSAVVRRRAIEAAGGFSETLIQLGDFDLWIRLAALGQFRSIAEPLTLLRIGATRNLSGPSLRAAQRSRREKASVLMRYAEATVLRHYPEVFPELPQHQSVPVRQAAIARYAAGRSVSHRLFADLLFEQLFACADRRAEITSVLGAKVYRDFVGSRCGFAMSWSNNP